MSPIRCFACSSFLAQEDGQWQSSSCRNYKCGYDSRALITASLCSGETAFSSLALIVNSPSSPADAEFAGKTSDSRVLLLCRLVFAYQMQEMYATTFSDFNCREIGHDRRP